MNEPIRKMKVDIYHLTCQRCGKEWIPVKALENVKQCPKCKTAYWQEPKK